MNNLNEARLKIGVFIDVDNISIGVKQSMNKNFDVGVVLEAIKEKGEIITKIAYGDWKRADDFSRAMTQHAIQMVQRNATPGGDKNGADIALALDALETAFTRPHINAFVIVGGDSDFIALVEKLKQYDKTVFVVGGRGFTSIILQKNCHEFISYENLVGVNTSRKLTGRIQLSNQSTLANTMPLIRRALKILSDREVSPQLGLLKSTLLQLDSTFSERDYGVGSFRDFVQKLADAGFIFLKQVDRSILVELKESSRDQESAVELKEGSKDQENTEEVSESETEPTETTTTDSREPTAAPVETTPRTSDTSESPASSSSSPNDDATSAPLQMSDAVIVLEEFFRNSTSKPHWPLYLRTLKQLLRSRQPQFDERQYGISSTYDLARQAQRDGLFHIERNRQGILRIFPGERFPKQVGELEEIATPISSDISLVEHTHPKEILEKSEKSGPAEAPNDSVPFVFPETTAEPEPFVTEQTEVSEKAPEPEETPTVEKAGTKSRSRRKPVVAVVATATKPQETEVPATKTQKTGRTAAATKTQENKPSEVKTTTPARNAQGKTGKTRTPAKEKVKTEKKPGKSN